MALVWGDRVLETTTTTGTGAITLAAAITGYQRFSAVCSTNDTIYYAVFAVDGSGNPSGDWETGLGTYSGANTLTRTTVSKSSNSNNAVDFAAGTKWVLACPIAAVFGGAFLSGIALTDPNADRIAFWDDSAGAMAWLTAGTGLTITGTTISASASQTVPIQIACSDETTALTTGTGKVTFRMPFAGTLTGVRASVTTAPTGSVLTVDINEGGSSVLSTKLTIDAGEKTSTTAATPAVISDSALADDAEITIDIDGVGSTIAGAGLKVTLLVTP